MIVYDLKELIGEIDEDGIIVQEVLYSLGNVSRRYGYYDKFRHNDNDWLIEYRTGEDMIKAPKEDDEDWLIETVVNHIGRGESRDLFESWKFRVVKATLTDNFEKVDTEEYFGDETRDYDFITDYYNNEGKRFVFLEYDYGYIENTFLVAEEDDDYEDDEDDLDEELKLREDIYDFKNGRTRKNGTESIYDDTPNKLSSEEEKSSTSEISSLEIENNEEVRTPETPFENGVAGLLSQAIVDEWTTIDEYNSILATVSQNEEEVPDGLVTIIQDIIAEEYVHIGQLESLLQTISPNVIQIENGKLEAEEELDTEEELIFKDKVKRG